MSDTVLRLDGVSKSYGTVQAVDRASLEVGRGEVFTLLGPSGCGKTTTLRLVAGLEDPDDGEITLRGRVVASVARRLFVPPHKRNLGMVFQSYAIWPHMSVFDNVAYPLRLRGVRGRPMRERVERVLELVGLGGLERRSATLLSGGQMQRLALCRALVYEPDLLLLDEPFSNLDAKLREQMRVELKLLQRRLGITVLFVTHDQIEALSLSNRLAVMHRGRAEQIGTPRSLYEAPASAFVRDFLGQTVILSGVVDSCGAQTVAVTMQGALDGHTVVGRAPSSALARGAGAHVAIRPEDIEIAPGDEAQPSANTLPGLVEALLFMGDRYEARVALGGEQRILLFLGRGREWREGQRVRLTLPPELVSVWPA
ncbi:MAG TPA: ABC transporter ATP-binding protein [Methylomirabilota bacterium]|jgi:ABC-type Fe3+/spermidine/putrescine transport system ATPase subunit|nr:ABC transporter ATP-binding protein [Methylomirabilota bacterium]